MKKEKKTNRKTSLYVGIGIVIVAILGATWMILSASTSSGTKEATNTEAYWRQKLTKQQYYVLRENGTDVPFSSPEMLHEKRKGTYVTADCGEPVFRSEQKYDSGTGWPSFWAPIAADAIMLKEDTELGVPRVEVRGKKCGTHLGHVFDDGPTVLPDGTQATGKRYCMNASALKFIPDKE